MPSLRLVLAAASLLPSLLPAQDKGGAGKPMTWTGVLGEKEFAALHQLKEGAAPPLVGADIEIGDAKAYLSMPKKGAPRGAVLVIHEWWGLNDHIKHWTDRLAADGYAALAIDLYGGKVANTREEASAAMGAVDADKALATLQRAHAFLATDKRTRGQRRACIGWCFGGGWSLRLAMAAPDLDAAVIYYGRLVDDAAKLAAIRAPVLGVFADKDRGIPPAAVDAFAAGMKKAGRSLELHRYDADHAFANPSGARYDETHAAAAWQHVRRFLDANLRPEGEGTFGAGRELRYALPEGWRKGGAKPMRMMTFVTGKCEFYIVALPGSAGGIGPNINRWRQQMGAEVLSDAELDALPRLPMLEGAAVVATIHGAYRGFSGEQVDDATMLAAACPLAEETVFVKMIGPKDEMAKQAANFRAFCRSMR